MQRPAPAAPSPDEMGDSRVLWATRAVVLVAFLDLFMQFPVIAPYARDLGATAALVGVVVALYSATNLVGNVAAGVVLDRWGRRRPLLFGLLATALALAGYALSGTTQQLMAARSVHGLTAALLTPGAFAILGDSARPGERARVMGVSGAFIAAAAVIGPLAAGMVRDRYGAGAVFLLGAALMALALVSFWYFGNSRVHQRRIGEVSLSTAGGSGPPLWRRPRLMASYVAALALTVGLGTLVAHLPIVMAGRGESATRTGLIFTVFAVVAMIAMASPLSRVSDRWGRPGPMAAGLALVAAGMLALGTSTGFSGAALGMGVFGLGFGVLFPDMTALAAESVQWGQRGKAFGVFYAVFSMGVVIGSLESGLLAGRLGQATAAPYLVSAAAALAAIPAVYGIWRIGKNHA